MEVLQKLKIHLPFGPSQLMPQILAHLCLLGLLRKAVMELT